MCNFEKFVYTIIDVLERIGDDMIQIRPIPDLQNDYNSIEKSILENGQTIYLTKNGYGSMVMMSLEKYSQLADTANIIAPEPESNRREHVEIISRPKKVLDDDDE